MPNQFLTLKDITAADHLGDPSSVGIVDNIVNVAPELDKILGRPIAGISYEALILTALGSNAGFRKINSGVPLSAPSLDLKRFNCFPFDCQMSIEQALLINRWDGGRGDSPAYLFTIHATSAARQKALKIGRQFYLGSLNDPNGPAGLMDFLFTQRTQVDSRTGLKIDQVIDCGGTIAGHCETIWFVKVGPQDVCWLFGNGKGIIQMPWLPQYTASADSTAAAPLRNLSWNSNLFGYIGTSFANYHAIGALINVDVVNGTVAPVNGVGGNGLWNDTVCADLYSKWPITESATVAICTKKAAAMLQKTRAVTNFVSGPGREFTTGIAPLGEFPTKLPTFNGIPLIVTDSIVPGNQVVLN